MAIEAAAAWNCHLPVQSPCLGQSGEVEGAVDLSRARCDLVLAGRVWYILALYHRWFKTDTWQERSQSFYRDSLPAKSLVRRRSVVRVRRTGSDDCCRSARDLPGDPGSCEVHTRARLLESHRLPRLANRSVGEVRALSRDLR